MNLSNTKVPYYYGRFRDAVLRGDIIVNREISMEMNRIDEFIENPGIYYDPDAVEGFISFIENEATLTDGSDEFMLDSFKVWAEELFGWYYYVDRSIWEPYDDGTGGRWVHRTILKRLINEQYIITARGSAKSMYASNIQSYFLNIDTSTTYQVTTAPTMVQADEVMSPIRTSITRARGPLYKFLTAGSIRNTSGSAANRPKLMSTKSGIVNTLTGSKVAVRPMSIDKLQGMRNKVSTVDEWLSGAINEDVIGALRQGATKGGIDDYVIIATSSEGTVRNGPGDTIKMKLQKILRGESRDPHISIWWYRLDDISEVGDPQMWIKANPNLGKTVSYETYHDEVRRMQDNPSERNDILAKRFGIPMEGHTYFFTYEETIPHPRQDFWQMTCSMGADFSQGDDFCAFSFLFPLRDGAFGVKTRNYISSRTLLKLDLAMRTLYDKFIAEGSLIVLEGSIIDLQEVYDDLDEFLNRVQYDVCCFGYDPYFAQEFVERWCKENSSFGVEKVRQGAHTESVPLGELKKLAQDRLLLFDEDIMQFAMGNCMILEDTNGNRKLWKQRYEAKIDPVAATMDAYVAYTHHREAFE